MPSRKDYYALLGVAKDASQEDIKRAYRKLARKLHPDVNPGDATAEERFKEISEAYHVLGDEERRAAYDRMGPEGFAQQFDMSDFAVNFGNLFRGGFGTGGGGRGVDMFEELLRGGLGGGGFSAEGFGRQAPPGRDVQVRVRLSLEEALRGGERPISYRLPGGETRNLRARIPAGVRDGARIRLRGQGASAGGASGDLYLQVEVAPHSRFRLQGDDLHVDVPVTVYEAALGATVEVPTLAGSTRVKLAPGTRGGQVLRLRGKGAPAASGAGDLLARVSIVLPETMDEEVLSMIRGLRDKHPYNPRKSDGEQE